MKKHKIFKKIIFEKSGFYYRIVFGGKPILTPESRILLVPLKLAKKIIAEFKKFDGKIIPEKMPFYTFSVASIDKVEPNRKVIDNNILKYIFTDALLYRANNDIHLRKKQEKYWQPVLMVFEKEFKISLKSSEFIRPLDQPIKTQKQIYNFIIDLNNFQATVFYKLVTLSGSFILSFLAIKKKISFNDFINFSFLEENHQQDKWGVDCESSQRRKIICNELRDALTFMKLF